MLTLAVSSTTCFVCIFLSISTLPKIVSILLLNLPFFLGSLFMRCSFMQPMKIVAASTYFSTAFGHSFCWSHSTAKSNNSCANSYSSLFRSPALGGEDPKPPPPPGPPGPKFERDVREEWKFGMVGTLECPFSSLSPKLALERFDLPVFGVFGVSGSGVGSVNPPFTPFPTLNPATLRAVGQSVACIITSCAFCFVLFGGEGTFHSIAPL